MSIVTTRLIVFSLGLILCSLFQLGCDEVPAASEGARSTVPETEETCEKNVPEPKAAEQVKCHIDLSSLNTPDRMLSFTPALQKSLKETQCQICHLYEQLELQKRRDGDFLAEFFPKEYPKLRGLLTSRKLQQVAATQIADTIYLILLNQHPGSTCPQDTKDLLLKILLENIDPVSYLQNFHASSQNGSCHSFFGYSVIEHGFFGITQEYVGYPAYRQ